MSLLANLFNRKKKIDFTKIKHPINYAFTVNGVKYYQFEDSFNIPYERALKSIIFFEELRMKCTYEYITKHQKALDKLLTDPKKINLFEVKKLNDQLGERLNLAYDIDTMYKLCSVVFFDETEDPRVYNYKYNYKKIDSWKEHKSAKDFFLQQPIVTLLPFLKEHGENLNIYSMAVQKVNKIHLESLQAILLEQLTSDN